MTHRSRRVALATFTALAPVVAAAQAPCPPIERRVDNDTAGSGYSEERPENWESRDVAACARTYRYLSRYVGDGTRRGRAIWRPEVPPGGDGFYAVQISYRATENRSTRARYVVISDGLDPREHLENQAHDGDCTRVDLGEIFCRAGGECRVVLDGDDGQSAAADETVFRRTRCEGNPGPVDPPPEGACAGIGANPAFELCREGADTCAGVFTDGAGCAAFCGAAGMICAARFGGEPGCAQEPQSPLPCEPETGHASDWCECVRPADADIPPPAPADAGIPPPVPADAATAGLAADGAAMPGPTAPPTSGADAASGPATPHDPMDEPEAGGTHAATVFVPDAGDGSAHDAEADSAGGGCQATPPRRTPGSFAPLGVALAAFYAARRRQMAKPRPAAMVAMARTTHLP